MNKRTRKNEISVLNVLFCMIVIFIHIISYAVSDFPTGTVRYSVVMLMWRLSSFVVQGFIMLSGVKLFLNKKEDLPYNKYLFQRLKGIVLPYTLCFFIYYICYMIEFGYTFDVSFILENFFTGNLASHFYFIVIIVQFDLLFPLWRKIVYKYSPVIIIPFASAFSFLMEIAFPQMLKLILPQVEFLYNDRLFTTYMVYWLIGCYIGKNYDEFKNILKSNISLIRILGIFSTLLMLLFSYVAYNGIAAVSYLNIIHDIYVLSICLLLYAEAFNIPDNICKKVSSILSLIDKSSFFIYLYHMLVLLIANKVIASLGIYSHICAFFIRCLIVYTVTPLVCISYIKAKKHLFGILKNAD